MRKCKHCDAILPPHVGRGRPREACSTCKPQRSDATVLQMPAPEAPDRADTPLVASVRAQLAEAGREGTPTGQVALLLAQTMGSPMNTGSSVAALARELRSTLADALKGAEVKSDGVADLAEKRRRVVGQ